MILHELLGETGPANIKDLPSIEAWLQMADRYYLLKKEVEELRAYKAAHETPEEQSAAQSEVRSLASQGGLFKTVKQEKEEVGKSPAPTRGLTPSSDN